MKPSITLETIVNNPNVLKTKEGLTWLLYYNQANHLFILQEAASAPLTAVLQHLNSDIQRFKYERCDDCSLPF